MAAVVSAGPSASATAITVTRFRQSARGKIASAQGSPTPRNIQARAGSSKNVGRSQSGIRVRIIGHQIVPRRAVAVQAVIWRFPDGVSLIYQTGTILQKKGKAVMCWLP